MATKFGVKPLPNISYGPAGYLPDWRRMRSVDTPDDDEELAVTPPDVVAILGFDPLDGARAEDDKDASGMLGEAIDKPKEVR